MGPKNSYKCDLTNLLLPLIMLSLNHQNHKQWPKWGHVPYTPAAWALPAGTYRWTTNARARSTGHFGAGGPRAPGAQPAESPANRLDLDRAAPFDSAWFMLSEHGEDGMEQRWAHWIRRSRGMGEEETMRCSQRWFRYLVHASTWCRACDTVSSVFPSLPSLIPCHVRFLPTWQAN